MDYQRHYDLLISRSSARETIGYVERHHIVPRCLGGGDELKNIVALSPEEHYLAHQLLVKINPGHLGLLGAAILMSSGSQSLKRSNKTYGWLRRQLSLAKTGVPMSALARERMSRSSVGRKASDKTKRKISEANKGKVFSAAHRAALSAAMKSRAPTSEETKQKMREAAKMRPPVGDETRRKMSVAGTGRLVDAEARQNYTSAAFLRQAAKRISKFHGITKVRRKWMAQCRLDGSQIYIGLFGTEENAARAYDAFAKEKFGELARLNFPRSE